jgi:hypothetical protein
MLTNTGSKLLDGAAPEAYSQWRFQPGTVSQLKMPIEFANRQKAKHLSERCRSQQSSC